MRSYAALEENLSPVDISDARNDSLIQQRRPDRNSTSSEVGDESSTGAPTSQRIGSDPRPEVVFFLSVQEFTDGRADRYTTARPLAIASRVMLVGGGGSDLKVLNLPNSPR